MREKLKDEVQKIVDKSLMIHKEFNEHDNVAWALSSHFRSSHIGVMGQNGFRIAERDAIRAILNHLNLELHIEPSKPESVVARKKAR